MMTDPELANAVGRIELHPHYAARPVREVRTDPLAYRWLLTYEACRNAGQGHEDAMRTTENTICAAASMPPMWPVPVPVTTTWPRFGASYYTSLTDPRCGPTGFAARLQDAGCTYTRVWLLDAWARGAETGVGCYDGYIPWVRDGAGVYDLDRVDPRYLDRLSVYVAATNAYGILPQLSGLDLYTWSERKQGMLWVPDADQGPFRRNRQGIYYADDNAFSTIGTGGVHGFLEAFYGAVVQCLRGLSYTVELANEMPEKALHYRLRDAWRRAGYIGSISINRNEDTPEQYGNMKVGTEFTRIAYHGRRDIGYLDEPVANNPTYRTFRQFFDSPSCQMDRVVMSSDGCRTSTNVEAAYDYPRLADVARDIIARGGSYEHQSCMKLRGFTEGRIDLHDLEVDWLKTLW